MSLAWASPFKTSAKSEFHYNLIAVSFYLDTFVPACLQIRVLLFEVVSWISSLFLLTLLQTVQSDGVYISAYDMTLLLLLGLLLL